MYEDEASKAKGTSVGIVIFYTEGGMIEKSVKITFLATNNVAKYEATLLALKELKEFRIEHASMHNDSRLVVNQVIKTFEAKEKKIKKYLVDIK